MKGIASTCLYGLSRFPAAISVGCPRVSSGFRSDAGSSGDRPRYVNGPVYVKGSDRYDLDGNNDG
jgi:hypothetical protein